MVCRMCCEAHRGERLLRSGSKIALLCARSPPYNVQQDGVPEVEEHQPRNPYNEITLLQGHDNIVRHMLVLDDER
jgi:hypothetical protein